MEPYPKLLRRARPGNDEETLGHARPNIRQRLLLPIKRRYHPTLLPAEKPLRINSMSGLSDEQLDEIESRIAERLAGPRDKGKGRPRGLTLREAVIVAIFYMRHNVTEEVIAEIFGTSQPVISRAITDITPLVAEATAESRPGFRSLTRGGRDLVHLIGYPPPVFSGSAFMRLIQK